MDAFIDIYCRIRNTPDFFNYRIDPANEDREKLSISVVHRNKEAVNNKRETYTFKFNHIFDRSVTQSNVFNDIAAPLIKNVINGYNCTVFAYGQTGSGKTFTITGGPEKYEERGLIPRCLTEFFSEFEKNPGSDFSVKISYLEIYNEIGYDLLQLDECAKKMEDLNKVTLQEDNNGQFLIKGLSLHQARSAEEAMNLLFIGDTNRTIAETPMNDASTRSHCIFTIHITSNKIGGKKLIKSKFHMVDLAGSERVYKSGLSGVLLKEAKFINKSLHYLEQTILCLSNRKAKHIPYRNSMLTSVLKDSLGGNCKTVMIANISVEEGNIFETISTCKFSQRVALIQNIPVINEIEEPDDVESLKMEIFRLKNQLKPTHVGSVNEEKCLELIDDFFKGQKIEANVTVNGLEISFCFDNLKNKLGLPNDSSYISDTDQTSLKDLVKQRDAEISILVNMLKRERTNHQSVKGIQENIGEKGSPILNGGPENDKTCEEDQVRLVKQRKTLLEELSDGQREIFEIYKQDGDEYSHIVEKQNTLRDLFSKAKAMGGDIFEWKEEINKLKGQIQNYSESDPSRVEGLRRKLQGKTTLFNRNLGELKTLKQETEHTQFVLEKLQIKLIKNFKNWWNLNHKFYENQRQNVEKNENVEVNDVAESEGEVEIWRESGDKCEKGEKGDEYYGDIPLTGDKEVDDDIKAFIKARTEILSRQ